MTTDKLRELILAHPDRLLWLSDYLKRHVLVLHLIYKLNGRPGQTHFSGLLFEYQGILYWVTAGHCIDKIREATSNTSIAIQTARWLDHDTRGGPGIPVDLGDMLAIQIESDVLDIAAVPLLGNTADLLRRSDTFAPFDERAWARKPPGGPALLAIAGYPGEWFRGHVTEVPSAYEVTFHAAHAILPVDPVVSPPSPLVGPPEWWGRDDSIYGSVSLPGGACGLHLDDIVGMSGGPAISLEWNEEHQTIEYRLCGIQSDWLRQSRFVRIVRIECVRILIDAYVKAMFKGDTHTDAEG